MEATKLGTHMIVNKKLFQVKKIKLILKDSIFPQRDFVCWWNLQLNMADYVNPFMPNGN